MKLVLISDTHGYHDLLDLPEGDLIIHAGDITKRGTKEEFLEFLDWFEKLNFKYKVFIAGNHDFYLEQKSSLEIDSYIPKSIHYLNDSGVNIEGMKIWGSPIQPWFFDFAFNRKRGDEIAKHWDLIPEETDLLITHGPPLGILDQTFKNESVGCQDLQQKMSVLNIKIHVFGHIHEAYGNRVENETHFINASVVNLNYEVVNRPVELEYDQIEKRILNVSSLE